MGSLGSKEAKSTLRIPCCGPKLRIPLLAYVFEAKFRKSLNPYEDIKVELGHRGDIHRVGWGATATFVNFTPSTGGSRWV